ncbi:MAG: succinate dehydrogenase cytochrome b subunit [Bacteroidia bacterium]|nr:succinate dehydrogenase cytochrome b subunit [Bacteroidia bacterium]
MDTTANTAGLGWLHTSVGRKVVMAVTGIFLMSFLVVHLAGNLLLLRGDGGAAFNAYADFMSTNPLIRVLEVLLFVGFVVHIYQGLYFISKERRFRPKGYTLHRPQDNTTIFSRTMRISAIVILVFLLVHLRHFFVEHRILGASLTMYESCKLAFENPFYSAFYVLSMILLAFHLAHGFHSSFQTLGLIVNRRIDRVVRWAGTAFAFLVPLGFAVIPLYFLFQTLY